MPLLNPTQPNLPDYLAFLYGVVVIPTAQLPSATGTATGGSTTTLTDASATWTTNQWAGASFLDVTQGTTSYVASNTSTTLTLATPLTAPVVVGDAYLLAPGIVLSSYTIALATVNDALGAAAAPLYALAVYNLGADRLINYATDINGQTYFADLRANFNINSVSVGVASSANDAGTSVGILNPEAMQKFTMLDLQTLKTPYGREYMGLAQQYGPALWGLT